jgi:hypothetical protein
MGTTLNEQVLDVSFTITDNATETPDVAIQFKDSAGNDIDHPVAVMVYLSTDAYGQTLAVDSTDTSEIAIKTDGTILYEPAADIMVYCVSETDGDLGLTITVITTRTVYVNVVMPNGEVKTCATALTYTA